jgi:ABC-type amino acid transport substrate-binding protein
VISLTLKQRNPDLEVIQFGADAKALTSVINGDIDAYVISSPIGNEWLKQFPKLKLLADIPYGKPFRSNGVTLESLNFFGVFVHKEATPEQKQNALNCINRSISQPTYSEEFARIGIRTRDFNDKEKDQLLDRYIQGMRRVGL